MRKGRSVQIVLDSISYILSFWYKLPPPMIVTVLLKRTEKMGKDVTIACLIMTSHSACFERATAFPTSGKRRDAVGASQEALGTCCSAVAFEKCELVPYGHMLTPSRRDDDGGRVLESD